MNKVASVTVEAEPLLIEVIALFGLVLVVGLLVLLQFDGSMGKFAPFFVGTVTHLHELTA